MLGDEIEVSVLGVLGETKVRIGIQAPDSLRVSRKDFVGDADAKPPENRDGQRRRRP